MQLAALVLLASSLSVGYPGQSIAGGTSSPKCVVHVDPEKRAATILGEAVAIGRDWPTDVGLSRAIRAVVASKDRPNAVRRTTWKPTTAVAVQPAQYNSPYYGSQDGTGSENSPASTQFDPYAQPPATSTSLQQPATSPARQVYPPRTPLAQSPSPGGAGIASNSYGVPSAAPRVAASQPGPAGYRQYGPISGAPSGPGSAQDQNPADLLRQGWQDGEKIVRNASTEMGDRARALVDQFGRQASSQIQSMTLPASQTAGATAATNSGDEASANRSIVVPPTYGTGSFNPQGAPATGQGNRAGQSQWPPGAGAQASPTSDVGLRGAQGLGPPSGPPLREQYETPNQSSVPSGRQPGNSRSNIGSNVDRWTSDGGDASTTFAGGDNQTRATSSPNSLGDSAPNRAGWPPDEHAQRTGQSSTQSPWGSSNRSDPFARSPGGQNGNRVAANSDDAAEDGPSFPGFGQGGRAASDGDANLDDYQPFDANDAGGERRNAPSINSRMLQQRADAQLEGGQSATTAIGASPMNDGSRQQGRQGVGSDSRATGASTSAAPGEQPPASWGAVLAAWVLLSGSVAGNVYLFWSYLDVRARFQSINRQNLRSTRDRLSAA